MIREGESLRRAFDERLNTISMQSFALTFQTIARELREAEQVVEARQRDLARRFAIPATHERLRLLMLVPNFPYPPTSGCRQRRWAMIRFLGQRHDLTLATFCSSEQSRQRPELLRYCRSVYAAAFDGVELPGFESMPGPVRERMRVTMRDALRSIPSDLYDAALIDSIFLAPFRSEISAPTILDVQSIELRLLMQAARADLPGPATTGFHDTESEAELMRDYEDQVWPQFAMRSTATAQDRDEIQRRCDTGQTILVENGTDPELWLADARPDTGRIIFFGNLGYRPNIDGILEFLAAYLAARRSSSTFGRAHRGGQRRDHGAARAGAAARIRIARRSTGYQEDCRHGQRLDRSAASRLRRKPARSWIQWRLACRS